MKSNRLLLLAVAALLLTAVAAYSTKADTTPSMAQTVPKHNMTTFAIFSATNSKTTASSTCLLGCGP